MAAAVGAGGGLLLLATCLCARRAQRRSGRPSSEELRTLRGADLEGSPGGQRRRWGMWWQGSLAAASAAKGADAAPGVAKGAAGTMLGRAQRPPPGEGRCREPPAPAAPPWGGEGAGPHPVAPRRLATKPPAELKPPPPKEGLRAPAPPTAPVGSPPLQRSQSASRYQGSHTSPPHRGMCRPPPEGQPPRPRRPPGA